MYIDVQRIIRYACCLRGERASVAAAQLQRFAADPRFGSFGPRTQPLSKVELTLGLARQVLLNSLGQLGGQQACDHLGKDIIAHADQCTSMALISSGQA